MDGRRPPRSAPSDGGARDPAMREPPTTSRGLRDGRAVFLDGERVDDVDQASRLRRIRPAHRRALRRAPPRSPDITTCLDPDSGRRIGAMWLIPRSAEDLGRRRAVHRFWAEGSYGLMGRTPDHVASVLTGFAGWRQLFDRGGRQFGDNVMRFYETGARRGSVRRLRHRAAPDRPLDPGPQASRAVPAPRRREGDRRGHRDPRRALDRHLGDHGGLAVRELHHAARARRRGLCHLARRAGRRGGTAAPPAPALRDDRHQRLRLPALRALRRGGHHRRLRRRVRALGAGLRLPERGAGDRAVPRVARPRPGELPVAGALRRQARAPRRARA